ncbi:MAG: orotidine 5'-phosphate decarboxylase [Gammaproteobacteria bacterium 39-13]|nr:orotidine-5'-phosphate decarboxylase [Gammaproteobacteria bacterium]OJV94308.1 MAG: orotidine 5'-phosphate decarboxylase [Gammaproteobacteria bacterium 39-13]
MPIVATSNPKVIIALDLEDKVQLQNLIAQLDPATCRLKIGKTLFTHYGPEWVKQLQQAGFEIFLDLKFHDIPAQVAGACFEAAQLGVWMTNVHALGGLAMLQAAKAAIDRSAEQRGKRPYLIGVTLLTSSGPNELKQLGITASVEETVMRLAGLCFEAGLDGVVCSANETAMLKKAFGEQFLCVTPGIRLPEDDKQDQQRVMTPTLAVKAGSDYLVIGRSVTHASLPQAVLKQINESIIAA